MWMIPKDIRPIGRKVTFLMPQESSSFNAASIYAYSLREADLQKSSERQKLFHPVVSNIQQPSRHKRGNLRRRIILCKVFPKSDRPKPWAESPAVLRTFVYAVYPELIGSYEWPERGNRTTGVHEETASAKHEYSTRRYRNVDEGPERFYCRVVNDRISHAPQY